MCIERRVHRRALPETDIARLVAAGDEDRIGGGDHPQHGWVVGRAAAVEHQGLYRCHAADLPIQPVLQLIGTGGAQDHHPAMAGARQPPLEGCRYPLAATHQHHRRLGVGRPRGLEGADLVIAVAPILQTARSLGVEGERERCKQQPQEGMDRPETLVHVDLPE
ncbi:hypothetical protein D3C71_1637880 [compost metagenome]